MAVNFLEYQVRLRSFQDIICSIVAYLKPQSGFCLGVTRIIGCPASTLLCTDK